MAVPLRGILQSVQSQKKMKIQFKTSLQLRKLVGVILLVCGLQLYGQQTVSGAEDAPKPPTYITFLPNHGHQPGGSNHGMVL